MWPEHPRDGQADGRPVLLVVVPALVVGRIAEDGVAADDVEGQGLAGQPRRGGHGHGAGDAIGKPRGPGQGHVAAQRSADDGQQPLDAQVIDQPPLHLDDVADGDDGEIGGVRPAGRRVDAVRARSCRGSRPGCSGR